MAETFAFSADVQEPQEFDRQLFFSKKESGAQQEETRVEADIHSVGRCVKAAS